MNSFQCKLSLHFLGVRIYLKQEGGLETAQPLSSLQTKCFLREAFYCMRGQDNNTVRQLQYSLFRHVATLHKQSQAQALLTHAHICRLHMWRSSGKPAQVNKCHRTCSSLITIMLLVCSRFHSPTHRVSFFS